MNFVGAVVRRHGHFVDSVHFAFGINRRQLDGLEKKLQIMKSKNLLNIKPFHHFIGQTTTNNDSYNNNDRCGCQDQLPSLCWRIPHSQCKSHCASKTREY